MVIHEELRRRVSVAEFPGPTITLQSLAYLLYSAAVAPANWGVRIEFRFRGFVLRFLRLEIKVFSRI